MVVQRLHPDPLRPRPRKEKDQRNKKITETIPFLCVCTKKKGKQAGASRKNTERKTVFVVVVHIHMSGLCVKYTVFNTPRLGCGGRITAATCALGDSIVIGVRHPLP